jgi:hypothetical protein
MADKLTPDAALTLHSTDAANASDGFQPVFQVLHVKKVSGNGPQTDRYRLILSDGAHFIQAMLATQHNHLLESQAVQKNTLVKLTSFALNMVQDRRLVIILGLEPVGQEDKIGDPKNVDTATAAEGAAPAPAAAAAAAKVKPEPVQQQQQKPQPAAKTGGFAASSKAGGSKGGRGNDHGPLYPIEGLSPYQNKYGRRLTSSLFIARVVGGARRAGLVSDATRGFRTRADDPLSLSLVGGRSRPASRRSLTSSTGPTPVARASSSRARSWTRRYASLPCPRALRDATPPPRSMDVRLTRWFSFAPVHALQGEIRATGFNEEVDKWFDFLTEGKVRLVGAQHRS